MNNLITPDLALRWKRMRFNPIRALTPQILALALDQFDYGYLRYAAVLWEIIEERDDILSIAAPKRKKAVSRRPMQVLMVDDSAAAHAHRETLTDFWNNVTVTDATDLNVRGGAKLLVRQMMSAMFRKYAVHEVVYKPTPQGLRAEFRFVPLYFFENLTGRLRFTGPEGGMGNGVDLPDNEWMITTSDSPIMKAASICYMFKRLSLQDWLNFSEKFGLPGIHGETPAAKDSKEFNDFVAALDTFANDWIVATNAGAKINLIEAKQNGDGPFAPMVERMDRRLAALCRGADLSTLSRHDASGASLQGDEQDLLIEDDCELISETLQSQISRFVIQYTYGTDQPLAYVRINPPQEKDIKSEVLVDQFLIDNGGELDGSETYERYNRTAPEGMPKGFRLKKTQNSPNIQLRDNVNAANDATPVAEPQPEPALLHKALANALGVVPAWLAPISEQIQQIEAKAADKTVTGEDLLTFVENAAKHLPELFGDMDFAGLADELENAMGTSVINGVVDALRKQK